MLITPRSSKGFPTQHILSVEVEIIVMRSLVVPVQTNVLSIFFYCIKQKTLLNYFSLKQVYLARGKREK